MQHYHVVISYHFHPTWHCQMLPDGGSPTLGSTWLCFYPVLYWFRLLIWAVPNFFNLLKNVVSLPVCCHSTRTPPWLAKLTADHAKMLHILCYFALIRTRRDAQSAMCKTRVKVKEEDNNLVVRDGNQFTTLASVVSFLFYYGAVSWKKVDKKQNLCPDPATALYKDW